MPEWYTIGLDEDQMEWDGVLRELADDPTEYERENGTVLFTRQGHDHVLTLRELPGEGLCVADNGGQGFVPISTYVQRDLLGLPRLSKQITKTLDKAWVKRPGKFVEGPADFVGANVHERWEHASRGLRQYLNQAEPGTTRLVQLMAAAGRGKTALLEHAALEFARQYQPVPYPTPILLTVDLLGRSVATVDDAIAGALNNTFMFPSLTQRDVALCIRRRWLLLALDGFDELVARVGVREAFLRMTELLDQLQSSGTVIVSARESSFELYQITAAMRSFLQPRNGTYSTAVVRLVEWGEPQGVDVFSGLGSAHPDADLADLMKAFDGDAEIVYHPFFLTRLADLWTKGERFADAERRADRLTRTKYVIETFIQRESGEKWIDRDGNVILNVEGHHAMLSGIAEEMWRSGAFWLGLEELRISAELGLAERELPREQLENVLERVPTHAALLPKERGYAFLHDRFLHFFLGLRIAQLLRRGEWATARDVLSARDLSPSIVEWFAWNWRRQSGRTEELLAALNGMRDGIADHVLVKNMAHVCSKVLDFSAATTGHAFRPAEWRAEAREAELVRLVEERTSQLRQANDRLQRLSYTDGLTNIANRRHFEEVLEVEWRRGLRAKTPVALMMIDIDRFKAYNDTFGHRAGDGCLTRVAAVLDDLAQRAGDLVARYGGDEFAAILAGTDLSGATEVAERLRAAIEPLGIESGDGHQRTVITVSVGVAAGIPGEVLSHDALLGAADSALYEAKRSGRNCVRIARFVSGPAGSLAIE